MKALQVQDVTVKLNKKALLNDVSFQISSGEIVALVGHNGAGKSTIINTIIGQYEKANGNITINEQYDQDEDYLAYKQHYSFLPEEPILLAELTVMQHFQLYAHSYQLSEEHMQERVRYYIKAFELTDKLDAYPESLSKGMRQKVQTICALLPDVSLLLIDEPFMGLDIYAMSFLEEEIHKKAEKGTAILITTHQLERIKDIAHSFIHIQEGNIVEDNDIGAFDTIQRRKIES